MNKLLWVVQIVAGLVFLAVGVTHFAVPEGLPDMFGWMYDLSDTLHAVVGGAEILGGLGLILPAVTRVLPKVIPYAALGLTVVQVGGAVYHLGRQEWPNIGANAVWVALLVFVAYGRFRNPIPARASA